MSLEPMRAEECQVLVVDIQQRLFPVLENHQVMLQRAITLLEAAKRLAIPISFLQQNTKGLGETVPELAIYQSEVFEKHTFSGFANVQAKAHLLSLKTTGRTNLVVLGSESHVCVYQTALDAIRLGFNCKLAWDATASRFRADKELAAQQLINSGCQLMSAEMIVFEWLEDCRHPSFKPLIHRIKHHFD